MIKQYNLECTIRQMLQLKVLLSQDFAHGNLELMQTLYESDYLMYYLPFTNNKRIVLVDKCKPFPLNFIEYNKRTLQSYLEIGYDLSSNNDMNIS